MLLPITMRVSTCVPGHSSMEPFSSVVSLIGTFTTSRTGGCATLRFGQS